MQCELPSGAEVCTPACLHVAQDTSVWICPTHSTVGLPLEHGWCSVSARLSGCVLLKLPGRFCCVPFLCARVEAFTFYMPTCTSLHAEICVYTLTSMHANMYITTCIDVCLHAYISTCTSCHTSSCPIADCSQLHNECFESLPTVLQHRCRNLISDGCHFKSTCWHTSSHKLGPLTHVRLQSCFIFIQVMLARIILTHSIVSDR